MGRPWIVAVVSSVTACTMGSSGPQVLGSPDDVHTAAGDYTGYRVVRPCPTSPSIDIGIHGTGTVNPTDIQTIEGYGAQVMTLVQDLDVTGGGGYGLVCESGVGTSLTLGDWRDVDTAIGRIGPWLAQQDLALQVSVSVDVFVAD